MQATAGRKDAVRKRRLTSLATLLILAALLAAADLASKSVIFGRLAQVQVKCPKCPATVRVPDVVGYTATCTNCDAPFTLGSMQSGVDADAVAVPNRGYEHVLVPHVLSFQLVMNPGGLFGFGGGHTELFVLFSLATMGLVIWMFFSFGHAHWIPFGALALVLGGALGNLWDRIVYGRVRDFILVYLGTYRWPNFNVADTWICVGVGALVVWLWTHPDATESEPEPSEEKPPRRKKRRRGKSKNRPTDASA